VEISTRNKGIGPIKHIRTNIDVVKVSLKRCRAVAEAKHKFVHPKFTIRKKTRLSRSTKKFFVRRV
jgi:hypothetical protein